MKQMMKPAVIAISLIGLAACSSSKETPKLDYQSQTRKIVDLEVPPDLTNPNQGNKYQIPAGSGAVRASDLSRHNNAVQQPASQEVLKDVKGVHIERDGSQRWLVVNGKTPAELWPLLKVFWQENGFDIKSEEPSIGQMETDWAENRAKIPQDALRRLFDKVGLGGVYSTSERDKFIIRVEKSKNGTTDIFFAHKGMEEVYGDKAKDTTMWEPRPNDPNLEAAFLGRFMQYLGADEQQVAQEVSKSVAQKTARNNELASLQGNSVLVSGDYNRTWRRTALALDRIGLTVVGQNEERHAFLVQQAPQEGEAVVAAAQKKPGMLKRWFGIGKDKPAAQTQTSYPQMIVFVEPVNSGSRITLLNKDGSAYQGSDASTLTSRLYTELR